MLAISVSLAMVPGFAATLGGLTGKTLGAGSAVVAACDTDGFTVTHTVVVSTVTAVNLSGIASTCQGGLLSVTLANSSGASIGSGGPTTVPAGGSMTVNVTTGTPAASAVAAVHVVVTGP